MKFAVVSILLLFTIGTALIGLVEASRGDPGARVLAAGAGALLAVAAIVNVV